jgi:hypothetical protein
MARSQKFDPLVSSTSRAARMQSAAIPRDVAANPWAYFHRAEGRPVTPRPLIRDFQKRLVLTGCGLTVEVTGHPILDGRPR